MAAQKLALSLGIGLMLLALMQALGQMPGR